MKKIPTKIISSFACLAMLVVSMNIVSLFPQVKASTEIFARDTFTRSASSSWGTSDTGETYVLSGTASDYAVVGSTASMLISTESTSREARLSSFSKRDFQTLVKFKTSTLAAVNNMHLYLFQRRTTNFDRYVFTVRLSPTQTIHTIAQKYINSTVTTTNIGSEATVTGVTHVADAYYWVRTEISGINPTTLKSKIWKDGTNEPSSWNYTGNDSESALQVAGGVVIQSRMNSGATNLPTTFTFDEYTITDVPRSSSGPSSTNFALDSYGFGNGGTVGSTSANYKINGMLGEVEAGKTNGTGASGPWYNAAWSYRKKITLEEEQIPGSTNLSNFPVLISIADSNLQSNAQADGDDILFTGSDKTTKLSHEIESYTSGTGALTAWVKIPSLSATADNEIYMYYGNSGTASQQDAVNVWDTNYAGVWHLKEDPSGAAPQMVDSKSANNATSYGSMTSAQQVAGKVGLSTSFNGTSHYLQAGNSPNYGDTADLTMSLWAYKNNLTDTDTFISKKNSTSSSDVGYDLYVGSTGKVSFIASDGTDQIQLQNQNAISTGSWVHITVVFDQDSTTVTKMYFNGTDVGATLTGTLGLVGDLTNTRLLTFGAESDGNTWLDGRLDEIRISNAVRSEDWIVTEYNNQNNPSAFHTLSAQETYAASSEPWYGSNWIYRKKITIEQEQIAGSSALTNFPVLISFTDAHIQSKSQSDGDDLLFTTSDKTTLLSHELETYNSSTGALTAWVKIPSLSATVDTDMYLYYGNPSAASLSSSTSVWGSDYKAVWHNSNNPGVSTIQDSTSNANNGTPRNMDASNLVTGKIGYALDFDGSSEYVEMASDGGTLDIKGTAQTITVCAWSRNDILPPLFTYPTILSKGDSQYILKLHDSDSFEWKSGNVGLFGNSAITTTGQWYHLCGVNDGTKNMLYINNVLQTSQPAVGSINDTAFPIWMGRDSENTTRYWDGYIDEVRVSTTAKNADWIGAEYNNQNDPASFHTVGSLETYSAGAGGSPWSMSGNFSLSGGLNFTLNSNVPNAPIIKNDNNYYNKLHVTIDYGMNADDTKFAIAASTDNFVSDIQYVQDDFTTATTLGPEDWLAYNGVNSWGGASGFTVIGLDPGTTYYFKVSAMQGGYTQSPFGPVGQGATVNPILSFDIDISNADNETAAPYSIALGDLTPSTIVTATNKVWVDMSTNGEAGGTVFVYGANGGLLSTSNNYKINAVSNNLISISEGYGIRGSTVSQTTGNLQFVSPYSGVAENVGTLDTSKRVLVDSSGDPVDAGRVSFEVKAKASNLTKSGGDYKDLLTIIVSASF